MKKCFLWIFIWCAALQFSCTSILHIPATLPAEVPVSNNQWKVVAINRYNPELVPPEKMEIKDLHVEGAQEAFYGALDAILEDSTFSLVHSDSAAYRKKAIEDSLNLDQLREIHQEYPHHLLLSLEHFDVDLEEERVMYEDSDGTVSTMAYFYLVVRTSWSLFDSTGTVLDKATLFQEEEYNSSPVIFGVLAIKPSFKKAPPVVNRLAWFTGYDYWSRLYPQPTTYVRLYYSSGKLGDAGMAMAAKDWEKALGLLEPLTLGKEKIAAKAAYNLAVVYEAMGLIGEARKWASKANEQDDELAAMLLKELEKYNQK